MRRVRSPAEDASARRHDRRGAAPSLDGVLELQRMAGNRAVASLAHHGPQPVMATVAIPGSAAIPARAWIPQDTSQVTELQFESSQEFQPLFQLLMQTQVTGQGLGDVTVSWGSDEATLQDARMTSYQLSGNSAGSADILAVRWSLAFRKFTKDPKRSSDRRGH